MVLFENPDVKSAERKSMFPIGDAVTPADLHRDPYPVLAKLQDQEPVSWIRSLNMWYVTRYEDVRAILMDSDTFTTAFTESLIYDTFGENMLTADGERHKHLRLPVRHSFTAGTVRSKYEAGIRELARELVVPLREHGHLEMRSAVASRLPIQTMLMVFGIPISAEAQMRAWYDDFEAALSNFTREPSIRDAARTSVGEFGGFIDETVETIQSAAGADQDSLLSLLVNAPPDRALSEDEIRRNLAIIFFGGISTVEALILNSLWALFEHPEIRARAVADPGLLASIVDETIRWHSPVQSATRSVVRDTSIAGVDLAEGEIVNAMLGAANRDPAVFPDPSRFDPQRSNLRQHLGFATGPHSCLGMHLAKAEARILLEVILAELPDLEIDRQSSTGPEGYEFHQPRRLSVTWRPR